MSKKPESRDFVSRTCREYAAWCATFYVPESLDERGMKTLDCLWAWQEQERRIEGLKAQIAAETRPVTLTGHFACRDATVVADWTGSPSVLVCYDGADLVTQVMARFVCNLSRPQAPVALKGDRVRVWF